MECQADFKEVGYDGNSLKDLYQALTDPNNLQIILTSGMPRVLRF